MSDQRGKLKIYLGYAAGVGKTWHMLDDAQRLHGEGVDVVIGYFEPHGRLDTIAKTEGLETVPRRKLEYRGSTFEDMDTDAILRRQPCGLPGRRICAHQCAWIGTLQALAGRRSAARCRHRRLDHRQCAAPGEPQ